MLITQIQAKIKDTAGRLTDPDDYNTAIVEALKSYSRIRPRRVVIDIVADGGHDLDLPAEWVADFSSVLSIEYPVGSVPETLLPAAAWKFYADPTGIKIRLIDAPTAGETIRLQHTAIHTEETVTSADVDAVANKAAALCCRMLASSYGQSSAPLIQADSVNYGDKVDSYRRLADSFDALYDDHFGIGKDPAVRAASATGSATENPRPTRTRLTHIAVAGLLLASLVTTARAETPTIGNDPAPVDLSIQAGEDFRARLTMRSYSSIYDKVGRPMNLTGYGYRSQISAGQNVPAFVRLSSVVVNTATGQVDISLSKRQTTAHAGKSGFWDLLQVDPSGAVRYVLKGLAKILPTVTK